MSEPQTADKKRRYSKENEGLRFLYPNFFCTAEAKRRKTPRIFLKNDKKAKRLLRFIWNKEISC